MDVYLMRHGDATQPNWTGDDDARPLTAAGVVEVKAMAAALASFDLRINRLLVSPLTRAQQTARLVANALGLAAIETSTALVPHAAPAGIARLLADAWRDRSVFLVCHEPLASSAASRLVGVADRTIVTFKTATVVRIEIEPAGLAHGGGQLAWLLDPKIVQKLTR